jgi:citrate synthase
MQAVDSVVAEAGRVIGHVPNVDLALGALIHVGGLPTDAPIFAVARIAGWVAHYTEEVGERPVRFRGLATTIDG